MLEALAGQRALVQDGDAGMARIAFDVRHQVPQHLLITLELLAKMLAVKYQQASDAPLPVGDARLAGNVGHHANGRLLGKRAAIKNFVKAGGVCHEWRKCRQSMVCLQC